MNKQLSTLVLFLAPAWALAQTSPSVTPALKPSASRAEIKAKAKNLAVAVQAAEAALTPGELAIAERVHVGRLPCELGNWVTLSADPKAPGYFNVQLNMIKLRMFPVETATGAIRLEDHTAGAVWLQLSNKSMLMSQKLGKRLADECMSPVQLAVAEGLKLKPAASILEPAPAVRP